MILFRKGSALSKYLQNKRESGLQTGFVPTMGALHDGHISLIEQARKENDLVICSIFVNPTQFNNREDFRHYPITIESDIQMLANAGCNLLYLPDVDDVYPHQEEDPPVYDLGALEKVLEGHFRPGHFQGVCQVVHIFLNLIQPDKLYLGQKDFQQCRVIERLLEITGWNARTTLRIGATRREADGLAMSSRNRRLSEQERAIAPIIYQSLLHIRDHAGISDVRLLVEESMKILRGAGLKPEYLEIVDAHTLQPVEKLENGPVIAVCAAWLGPVRLIDNLPLQKS